MDFISTRDHNIRYSFSDALLQGLAADGGLYIPEQLPKIDWHSYDWQVNYATLAANILDLFCADDILHKNIAQLCHNAFNFPVPITQINHNTWQLELFHGPTLSFKDFGARFLAECMNALSTTNKTTIIVATSGDTGSAVASAFYQKPNCNVIVLFPKDQISQRQQQQITCWGNNVLALAVEANFDECQKLVKAAFADPWWQQHTQLSTANSINIGRLLPQIVYYAYASIQFNHHHGCAPGIIVPSGNLGNVTAAYWAKNMGFPIREIVIATNANRVIPDYLITGEYTPRPSISTLANAMDVGKPSNFERLNNLFSEHQLFKQNVHAVSVTDSDIKATIQTIYQQYGVVICPHTATGFFVRQQLSEQAWLIAATADPSKFDEIIQPLLQIKLPVPAQLHKLLKKPQHYTIIKPSLKYIIDQVQRNFHY